MKHPAVHLLLLFLMVGDLHAQGPVTDGDSLHPQRSLSANFHYGSVFAHSEDVANTRYSRPRGLELAFSKLRNDSATASLCNCITHTGFAVNYFDYDNRVLGHGVSALYFLEPNFRISNRLLWNLRGTVGFSFMTNPYHPISNPDNMSYSLPFGAYLGVSTGFNVKLAPRLMIGTAVNYLHISNGGIKDPNLGINWITGSLGLYYDIDGSYDFRKHSRDKNSSYKKQYRLDLTGFYSSKIVYIGDKTRYNVFGMSVLYSHQLNRLHAVTASADWHIDYSLAEKQRRENAVRDVHFWSMALGHEFLLGRFIFSQQLGYYLDHPEKYYDKLYHRWGLNYMVRPNLHLGFGLKAHRHVAHFADVRLVYSFTGELKK